MTYAIVKTGGKQYRVEQGQTLLVERLPVGDGESVNLQPLLFVDGSSVVDGEDLAKVSVEARVVAHERGPKLRVVKFKPKRGYKRRTGHRQELTRIEVVSLGVASGRSSRSSRSTPKPVAADAPAATPAAAPAEEAAVTPTEEAAVALTEEAAATPAEEAAATPAEEAAATPTEEAAATPTEEAQNGS
jgi:large subunit ribosomal protein L21